VAGTIIYDSILMDNIVVANYDVFYTYNHMFSETVVINVLVTILIIVAALLPDFVILVASDTYEKLQHTKKTSPQ
jgi:hypothetical protein